MLYWQSELAGIAYVSERNLRLRRSMSQDPEKQTELNNRRQIIELCGSVKIKKIFTLRSMTTGFVMSGSI